MCSVSVSKSVPCWFEYLLRLEVTWLILVVVASCLRTREKWREGAEGCTKLCYKMWSTSKCFFFAWLSLFLKDAFRPLNQKGGCFCLSYLHATPGYLIAEVLLWGNAGSHDCGSQAGAEVLSSLPCSISCLMKHTGMQCFSLVLLLMWSFQDLKPFIFLYLHNISLFILPCCVTVQAGRVAVQRTLQCDWYVHDVCGTWQSCAHQGGECGLLSWDPLFRGEVTAYLHGGWWGKSRQ